MRFTAVFTLAAAASAAEMRELGGHRHAKYAPLPVVYAAAVPEKHVQVPVLPVIEKGVPLKPILSSKKAIPAPVIKQTPVLPLPTKKGVPVVLPRKAAVPVVLPITKKVAAPIPVPTKHAVPLVRAPVITKQQILPPVTIKKGGIRHLGRKRRSYFPVGKVATPVKGVVTPLKGKIVPQPIILEQAPIIVPAHGKKSSYF